MERLDDQDRCPICAALENLSKDILCKRKSGELVFGSNEGIVSFDPVQLTDGLRKIPESLRITNLTIGDSREKQGFRQGYCL